MFFNPRTVFVANVYKLSIFFVTAAAVATVTAVSLQHWRRGKMTQQTQNLNVFFYLKTILFTTEEEILEKFFKDQELINFSLI